MNRQQMGQRQAMSPKLNNRMLHNSVRARLVLWNSGVFALVLTVLGITLSVTSEVSLKSEVNQNLKIYAANLSNRCQNSGLIDPLASAKSQSAGTGRLFILDRPHFYPPRILDLQGHLLLQPMSDSIHPEEPEQNSPLDASAFAAAARGRSSLSQMEYLGGPISVYSSPLIIHGKTVGVIQVARSLADVYDEISRVNRRILALIPFALLAAAVSGAFLTNRALSPVGRIAYAAGLIQAEDNTRRLPIVGNDEFAELAVTINGMLSRLEGSYRKLEHAYEQQRRFAADASHELRTPLTVIKANTSLELLEDGSPEQLRTAMAAIDRAADRTGRIIEDLLLLARSDSGEIAVQHHPTDLGQAICQALEMTQTTPSARILLGSNEIVDDHRLHVLGDRDSLVRLFTNLLNNAIRYTPEEGQITILAKKDGEMIRVIVADTGEGILSEHLPHVSERFYRADKSRTRRDGGTGLGLAICKSIAEAHNGTLSIESTYGEGTRVIVELPAV